MYAIRSKKSFWYKVSWNPIIQITELLCERHLIRMVQVVSQWSYPMRCYYSLVLKDPSCWVLCTTKIDYRIAFVSNISQWFFKLLWWYCTIVVRRWYYCVYIRPKNATSTLQDKVEHIPSWMAKKLCLHIGKTALVHFLSCWDESVKMATTVQSPTKSVKYLGVHLDKSLTFEAHV